MERIEAELLIPGRGQLIRDRVVLLTAQRSATRRGWPIGSGLRVRPVGVAGTPQPAQSTIFAVVWTTSCHSPPLVRPSRPQPSRSNSSDPDARPC
jgi:hypothetical protein